LHFHAPIRVGWTANIEARVIATFHTSMEIGVTVHSENPLTGERKLTTSALLTFVALDRDGNKLPVPQLEVETPAQRQAVDEAQERRQARLARKDAGKKWLELFF
jgi:acyl-CoA hydrolase